MEIGKHYKPGPLSTLGSLFSSVCQPTPRTRLGSLHGVRGLLGSPFVGGTGVAPWVVLWTTGCVGSQAPWERVKCRLISDTACARPWAACSGL